MIHAELTVPIVLPIEKCVRVPLPDNYTIATDSDAAVISEGQIAQLTIRYFFDVGIELPSTRLVQPSAFVLVPFYVVPLESNKLRLLDTKLRLLGTGKYEGVSYGIYMRASTDD